jgi:hypothetical protein
VPGAFYEPDSERFASTGHTRGPWDPGGQHAGPPAALLGREIERCGDPAGRRVGRITFELLRAVPIAPLTAHAEVVRPGRSVELVEGALEAEGEPVMRARAWRLRTQEVELPAGLPSYPPPPGPSEGRPARPFAMAGGGPGWHAAMEIRFVSGEFLEPGPAVVWMRPRIPLVEGEAPSALARLLLAADAGIGRAVQTLLIRPRAG